MKTLTDYRAFIRAKTKHDTLAGFGSVPYKAVEMGRCGVGIELKDSYFKWACRYIEDAELMSKVETLFDVMGQ